MRYLIALLVVFALVASACSDGDAETTTTTTTAEQTTTTAASEETTTTSDGGGEVTTTTAAPAPAEVVLVEAADCEYGGKIRKIEALDRYTVQFTMCGPLPAFPQMVAFSPFGIQPSEHLEATGGAPLDDPIGTGPFKLVEWRRGDSIIFEAFEDYWGDGAPFDTLVFRWAADGTARLLELQAGAVDQIANLSPDDVDTVEDDADLTLLTAPNPNTLYLAMTSELEAADDDDPTETVFADVDVREAIAVGIDRERIVEEFFPEGSEVASHFTPCSIPNGCVGQEWYEFDPDDARQLLADAGYPGGFETAIYYRDVRRGYLPDPGLIAVEFQAQLLENLGIAAEVIMMESDEFIDEATNGRLDGFYLLGWGARYPHVTDYLDVHFGSSNPQFGEPHPEIYERLEEGAQIADPAEAVDPYTEANDAIRDLVPMVPIAHSASASAASSSVENAHIRPFGAPLFERTDPGKDTFVWMQNAEPISLYCNDETDRDSLAACQQVVEPLLGYAIDSGAIEPRLATECTGNEDATVWTCSLREGVKFHDGSDFDAGDVIASWSAGISEGDPLHVGNTGAFEYYRSLFDALIPPAG
jgi:ABC-type transport system substrate-binding protein